MYPFGELCSVDVTILFAETCVKSWGLKIESGAGSVLMPSGKGRTKAGGQSSTGVSRHFKMDKAESEVVDQASSTLPAAYTVDSPSQLQTFREILLI